MSVSAQKFQPKAWREFHVLRPEFDGSTVTIRTELRGDDGAVQPFAERITFDTTLQGERGSSDEAKRPVDEILRLLALAISLSYYKTAAPATITVDYAVGDAAQDWFRQLVRNGLGEFAYVNKLDGLLEPAISWRTPHTPVDLSSQHSEARQDRAVAPNFAVDAPLVAVGGGKDSSTSVELLRAAGFDVVQFATNPNSIIRAVVEASELPLAGVRRVIDPVLFDLNEQGALNGHVPVTAMNSLIGATQSALLGLGPVVMSNENSANDPNLYWNGEPVNHQWSKSLDAEKLLTAAIDEATDSSGTYFSLLRHMSELRIMRAFSAYTRYDHAFVSCNRAFRRSASSASWCRDCDKCRFIFLIGSMYMSPDRLVSIFGGDMFADDSQYEGFRALLGEGYDKPFDCVGEAAESLVALAAAAEHPEWGTRSVVRRLVLEIPDAVAASREHGELFIDAPRQPFPDARYEEAVRGH